MLVVAMYFLTDELPSHNVPTLTTSWSPSAPALSTTVNDNPQQSRRLLNREIGYSKSFIMGKSLTDGTQSQ